MRKFLSVKNAVATLAFALFVTAAVGATEAKAAPTYNPKTDKLETTGNDVYYVANVKKAEGAKLKSTSFQTVTSASAIAMEKGGLKASASKDAYIYWTSNDPSKWTEEDIKSAKETAFPSNLTIKGYANKKTVVNLDYTKLGKDAVMVSGVTVTKNESGAAPGLLDGFATKVSWTEDPTKDWNELSTFTGELVEPKIADNKYVVYFRVDGTADQRSSKMVKVTLAKRAKAPSIKVDVKKLSLNVKNGYDFVGIAVASGSAAAVSGSSISVSGGTIVYEEVNMNWRTILPYNKEGAYKNTDPNIKSHAIKTTANYTPLDKKVEGALANSYTNEKKTLDLKSDLYFDEFEAYGDSLLFVARKTATTKKPASLMNFIIIDSAAGAPKIKTVEGDRTETIIATASSIAFTAPTIEKDYEMVDIPDAEPGAETEKKVTLDDATAKFEYAIVKKTDFDAETINFASVSWKTIKTGTKLKANAKSKYTLLSDSKNKIEATIGETSYLLIRRAGVSKTGTVASDLLITGITKGTDGYKWSIE